VHGPLPNSLSSCFLSVRWTDLFPSAMGRTVSGGRLVISRPHKVKSQCVTLSPPRAPAVAKSESKPLTPAGRAAKRLFTFVKPASESFDNIAQSLHKMTDREPWPLPSWVRSIGR
jgi:hypothetical protein